MELSVCPLASGSSGNCYIIRIGNEALIVDAGISASRIREGLERVGLYSDSLRGVLITHEHGDHVAGLPMLLKKNRIPLYATSATVDVLESRLPLARIEDFKAGSDFEVDGLKIETFSLHHDAVDPVGYSFELSGKRVTFITDTGAIDEEMLLHITKADILVLESNHDEGMLKIGSYPWPLKKRISGEKGHLSNETAAAVLAESHRILVEKDGGDFRKVLLAHLSRENNFPEMALATLENVLASEGLGVGLLNKTTVLPPDCIGMEFAVEDEKGMNGYEK